VLTAPADAGLASPPGRTAAIDDAPMTAAVPVRNDRRLVAEAREVDGVTVSPFHPTVELALASNY
jgi:hypothetical protein